MGIKIGADVIQALYIGEQKIVKAYAGEELVFTAKNAAPSRLPAGYTEVEYIESNGECYIDTNIKPIPDGGSTNSTLNADTKIVIDVELLDAPTSTDKYIVYTGGSTTLSGGGTLFYRFYIFWGTTAGIYVQLAQTKKAPVSNTALRRMSLELDGMNGTYCVDGIKGSFTDRSLAYNTATIKLLGDKVAGTKKVRAKLYSCQIYKGTDLHLVRDFVPCIDSIGNVGLYDLVDNSIHVNKNYGSGKFTPGPAV